MEKHLRVPHVAMVLSILLPYAIIEEPTWIFSTNQQWLFPFWYYIHDYGVWFEHGIFKFLYPFPWYEFPLVFLGILWFVLGLSISKLLHELYLGRIQQRFFVLLLLGALASQVMMTSIVLLQVYIFTLDYVMPLPVHTLLVLILSAFVPERYVE